MDQLAEATHRQGTAGGNLGAILVELGHLTEAQLQQVLRARQQVVARAKAKQSAETQVPVPEAGAAEAAPSQPAEEPVATRPAAQAPPREAPPISPETPPAGETPAKKAESRPRPAPAAAPAPQVRPGDVEPLLDLLRQGVERGASDIHVHSRVPLRLRLHGRFEAAGEAPIEPEAAERMLLAALDEKQRTTFLESGEIDFAYSVPGLGRFRSNLFRQQRGTDGVFRHIPDEAPSLEDLGLPTSLAKFTNYHQGLVLVTGPANCGKSSTLAAMVDIINTERKEHILTIEDPVEYVHPSKRCVVNQRNVGAHTHSFARALKGALREDPDVIVIGELRDLETVSLALSAAETGHLVLATLHTNSTIRTVNRLVGVFPAEQQDQIRNMVSESLRAVVSQRLIPTADGQGRVPALEVLVTNKAIGNLIRENKTFQISSMLQTGMTQGMCLLEQSLAELVTAGTITREEAIRHCDDPRKIPGA
ncbi:MAG: type IV pili twitching motility protein PilT [Deltaproteobacteria bacterium]|nr:type IV pili twitching motility protein PilT [Deltaproteobacteria bacterium]